MSTILRCHECGAAWVGGVTCQEHFYQMGFWETERPNFAAEVHHLMVLCYHLQHPGLYSPDGLQGAKALLVDFLERGLTPQDVRRRDRAKLNSGRRKFKIKVTPASHGEYAHPPAWTMTAANVIAGGVERYCDNVKAWARAVFDALEASGNLSP